MPELVCRIQWRKGLPLSLSISPRPSFLDLPRELRDRIYYYSLVASGPITVWSGTHEEDEYTNFHGDMTSRSVETVDISMSVIDRSAVSLIRCNRQVSREAAAMFYRWNTFRFLGHDNWNPLYAFLHMIGEENKSNLRILEMEMHEPKQVRQHPDGTLTDTNYWRFRRVLALSPRLQTTPIPYLNGQIEYLDPAIEACFRILGKDRPALTLMLILTPHYLPGVRVMLDEQNPEDYFFSLDIPVMIEKFRQDLTANSGTKSRVEILWKGGCFRDRFVDQIKLIQNSGWMIIDAKEECTHRDTYPVFMMLFTLRRKELSATSFPVDTKPI